MSMFVKTMKKTVKKAAALSLTALTALSCAVTMPSIGSMTVNAASNVLSNEQRGVIYANSRSDFRDETIYFLITTRFYDGDSSNNFRSVSDAEARNPESDPSWRGDFKGLIDKLDYIKALGFTAIWITPVVQNNSNYDYHGYHASNFNAVDYRYESNGVTYQTLIDACHQKGMKVIQDVVFNHTCRNGEEGLNKLGGEVMTNQLSLPWPKMNEVIMSNGAQYDPNSIYHHNAFAGSGDYDNYNAQIMTIADDCFDLETENPVVANYLVDAYKKYIDMGVDAFRVDTARHISRITMNAGILPKLQAEAERIGNNDFYMFGEVCTRGHDVWYRGVPAISTCFYTWDDSDSEKAKWSNTDLANNEALAKACYNNNESADNQPTSDNAFLKGNDYHKPDYSKRSNMGVIDFQMHWSFENANNAFGTALGEDRYFNDSTWNVVYVNSHDYSPDFCSDKVYTGDTASWAENLSLMFTFRGIPCVYYGTEIEFQKGCPIDKGPKAMLSETGRAYYGDNIEGTIQSSDFTVFNATGKAKETLDSVLSQHIMRLNRIRMAVPALRKGQYSTEGCNGGISFKRRYTDDNTDSFACVAISGSATFSGVPNGTYVDAVTGDTKTVTNGTLSASVSGKGNMKVYVLSTSKTPAPGRVIPNGKYLTDGGAVETIGGESVNIIPATGISLNKTSVTVLEGETAAVTATVTPSNASDKSVTWSSADTSVATVSSGTIKGVAEGTTTITAKTSNNLTATVKVTVKENTNIVKPTGITVSPSSLTLTAGETGAMTATVTPSNATDKSVTWTTSNAAVATVSGGTVTAVGQGTATITATTSNGKTASATVTVEGKSVTYIENGVYFEKPSGWGNNINIYIYDGASDTTIGAAWPGTSMKADGNNVYYYEYKPTSSMTKIIFNDGNNQIPGAQMPGFDFVNRGYYTSNGYQYTVEKQTNVEVTAVTLNKTSASVAKGSTVTLTATVAPSNATNKTITWSSSNTAVATVSGGVVTGVSAGTATITAKSNNGKTATATVTVSGGNDDEVLTASFSISPSTITAGEKATFTVSASGGKAPYQYALYYKKSTESTFSTYKDYTTSPSFSFSTTTAGTYNFKLKVKDSKGTVVSKTANLVVKSGDSVLTNKSTVSATSISLGSSVTITAAASGGASPYQYAVYYKKSSSTNYTAVQAYSTNKSIKVTPAAATNYDIRVKVKDSTSKVVNKDFTVKVNPGVLKNVSTVSATSITLGKSVTVTGKATGGTSPYQYAAYYKKASSSSYTLVRGYSSTATMTVKPAAATTYDIRVKVKDKVGTVVNKDFTVKVTGSTALTNKSTISATKIGIGSNVVVTGAASGGTSPYQYAAYYKKASSTTYTKLRDYSTNTKITVTPKASTTYDIRVKVKDKKGTVSNKDFTVIVTNTPTELTNKSTISATKISLGKSVTVTGAASGGTTPYYYCAYYKKASSAEYTQVCGYSKTTKIIVTPKAATTYNIRVKVKDGKGTVVRKDFTVRVTA